MELKIEGLRKRGRPVKRWIDTVEEHMKTRCRGQGAGRVGGGVQ